MICQVDYLASYLFNCRLPYCLTIAQNLSFEKNYQLWLSLASEQFIFVIPYPLTSQVIPIPAVGPGQGPEQGCFQSWVKVLAVWRVEGCRMDWYRESVFCKQPFVCIVHFVIEINCWVICRGFWGTCYCQFVFCFFEMPAVAVVSATIYFFG